MKSMTGHESKQSVIQTAWALEQAAICQPQTKPSRHAMFARFAMRVPTQQCG